MLRKSGTTFQRQQIFYRINRLWSLIFYKAAEHFASLNYSIEAFFKEFTTHCPFSSNKDSSDGRTEFKSVHPTASEISPSNVTCVWSFRNRLFCLIESDTRIEYTNSSGSNDQEISINKQTSFME